MKKQFILFLFILIISKTYAQKDSLLSVKINNIDAKTDHIESFIKKLESSDQKNRFLEDSIIKLNRENISISSQNQSYSSKLNSAQLTIGTLQLQADNVGKYKAKFEKIISLLSNEHATFNPELIKILEDASKLLEFSNVKVLENFIRLGSDIEGIKNYVEKKPYDSIENINYLSKLSTLKKETAQLKFENLESDVDFYIDIVSTYCLITKKIGTTIAESVGKKSVRDVVLLDLKKKYKDYIYLITEIEKAQRDPNYKFNFRATCTD